jgi:hypothetical protein
MVFASLMRSLVEGKNLLFQFLGVLAIDRAKTSTLNSQ